MVIGNTPVSVRLRTYNVGFGDCFLLTFRYRNQRDHHLLIDCGSTRMAKNSKKKMVDFTRSIVQTVQENNGQLDAVVATHRHRDHISGFAGSAGEHFKKAKVGMVLQPWTEDPTLEPDATSPPLPPDRSGASAMRFTHQLASMERLADSAPKQLAALTSVSKTIRNQVNALSEVNLTNREAVETLRALAPGSQRYLSYGQPSGLEDRIPGISVDVLGPPTIDQWEAVRRQRNTDDSEFWHLIANAVQVPQREHREHARIFPDTPTQDRGAWAPPVNWLVPKLEELRGNQLLSLVRILDRALNNTSLILLIKVGDRRLLFSGDAQIESWEYPLFHAPDKARLRRSLRWTNVYKVGHHGSLNATPKSLWNLFERQGRTEDRDRLIALLSTTGGVHGHGNRGTEVPRRPLVEELSRYTTLIDSRRIRAADGLFHDVEISTSRHRQLIQEQSRELE